MRNNLYSAALDIIGGVVDVNAPGAAAPGSSAFASLGVAPVPEGAMVPLFSANRDDGSKVVDMVVKSVDGIRIDR